MTDWTLRLLAFSALLLAASRVAVAETLLQAFTPVAVASGIALIALMIADRSRRGEGEGASPRHRTLSSTPSTSP
ncbi:hypothetical protein BH23BAC4_BH23BAC4_00450 [soil metagenome]